MKIESKPQILRRRKEIEGDLESILKEIDSSYTLNDIKDMIYHEKDGDEMTRIIMIFDRGNDISELNSILEVINDAWNYFPHKILNNLSPMEILLKHQT